jgi:hypothetical protein
MHANHSTCHEERAMERQETELTAKAAGTEVSSIAGTEPAARRKTAGVPRGNRRGTGTAISDNRPDVRRHLRQFVTEHPAGWGHDDWLALLGRLQAEGHEVHDPDAIGVALERERLSAILGGIQGMGAQRIRSLSERYGSLWNLRQAGVEDLATSSRLPRAIAERIQSAI